MDIRKYTQKSEAFVGWIHKKFFNAEASVTTHWKLLVGFFSIVAIAIFIWSFVVYQDVERGDFLLVESKTGTIQKKLNEEIITAIIKRFDSNAVTFREVRLQSSRSVDPSL